VLVSDDVVFTEGGLAAFLNKPSTPEGKQLGEAVETLAQEKPGRPAPVTKTAPATPKTPKEPAVSDTPATDAGETKAAGEGVSDQEMASEVAEQTTPDLKAEEAFEKSADKKTDEPADKALADEVDDEELGGES